MATSRGKTGQAEEYLLGRQYSTDKEVMKEVGCSEGTVRIARKRLRESGLISRRPNDHSSSPVIMDTEGARDILAQLDKQRGETGDALTIEEKLKKLARFTRVADLDGDYKKSIDAMVAHTKLEESTKAKEHLGPAEPLTEEERLMHTVIIFDVAGPTLSARAAIEAFKEGTELEDFCIAIGRFKATAPRPQTGTDATPQAVNHSEEA